MKYVIGFYYDHYKPHVLHFVKLYENKTTYTGRLHGKIATQFNTHDEALATATRLGVVNPDIRVL